MGPSPALPSRGQAVRVFLLAFVVYAYFMPRWADWNTDSRLALVHAIVDRHTVRIDRYHWITWDKAVYKGHFYSDKAPGTAALGALVYAAYRGVTSLPGISGAASALKRNSAWNLAVELGKTPTRPVPSPGGTPGGCQRAGTVGVSQWIPWGNRLVPPERDWALSKYVVTVGVDALLSAAFVAFFFWFLGFFVAGLVARLLVTFLYAFATVAMPYSTLFYSHQIVAGTLFVAFALLFLWQRGRAGRWAPVLTGFLLGFSIFTEYTVAVIVAVLGLLALWMLRRSPATLSGFLLAGAVPLLALLAYNYACFGNPLDTGYSHDFCWSPAQGAGFAGFTYPHAGPLFDLTFGSFRGLFYMSPFLLFALPGAVVMMRRGFALEGALCLVVTILFILMISAYWGWNGGKVEGPRYLVPVVPFLALPAAMFIDRFRHWPLAWAPFALAAAWSLFVTWTEFLGGTLFPISWWRDPLFQYSVPALTGNQIAPNAGMFLGLDGWQSLIPLALLVVLVAATPARRGPQGLHLRQAAAEL